MIARMSPHIDQIRWYVRSALNGFDTLDHEDAIENAKGDLTSLLAYLDRADKAVRVLPVEVVEPRVGCESVTRQHDRSDFSDLEIVRL
jgi:hypothetical protein